MSNLQNDTTDDNDSNLDETINNETQSADIVSNNSTLTASDITKSAESQYNPQLHSVSLSTVQTAEPRKDRLQRWRAVG